MFQRRSKNRTFSEIHWKKKIHHIQEHSPQSSQSKESDDKLIEKDEHDDDNLNNHQELFVRKFKLDSFKNSLFAQKMSSKLSAMTNVLRNVVSKQRIRYKEKGFNLDLAYICDNIIAMGYPADNYESIYRNRYEDVYKFLEENHLNHYKIYNLCLERSYDKNKFHGRVALYSFEDHNPPTIELIQKFCDDVDTWLKADPLNVAAVHCKAGKGRTGTMICCYLLYSRQHSTAKGALDYYDEKRTKDRKGVTIPSQRRYVQYFSKLLQSNKPYENRSLQFCEIRFSEANILHNQGTVHCSISGLQDTLYAVEVKKLYDTCIDFRKSYTVDLKNVGQVTGDIKVELNTKPTRKKIFHFWVNTYFITDDAAIEGEGDDARYVYTLNKNEIDDAHKDKDHKCYTEDFKVQLVFFVNSNRERANCATAISNRVSNSNNHHDSAMNMGTTRIFANTNSQGHPTSAQQMSGEMSYYCDQRSSSSSASISSLAGGISGSGGGGNVTGLSAQISSGNSELLSNSTTTTIDRFKRNSNGNATSANADIKSQHQLTNKWRPGGLLNREAGAETLVEYNYVTAATGNNVTTTAKLKEQQQYKPSENNVNIVPPSKVSRGSNHNAAKAEAANEVIAIDAYGKTVAAGVTAKNISSNMPPNNLSANKNGVNHWKNDNNEHDASCSLHQQQYEDDDDVGEDWESGESSAKSLSHKATGNLTQTTETTTTKNTFENKKSQQTQPPPSQSQPNYIHNHHPSITNISPLIPSNLLTAARPMTYADQQQHDDKSSSNLHKLMMGYTSVNLVETELTNTNISCSRRSSFLSKAYIGGDNNGNESSVSTCTSASVSACASSSSSYASFKNVVNNDLDEKVIADDATNNQDDDDHVNDSNSIKQQQQLPPQTNEKKVQKYIKTKSNVSSNQTAIATPTSRNKFFNFTLSKASTNPVAAATDNAGVVAIVSPPPPKQPFFRRKSFKSAVNSAANAECKESAADVVTSSADAATCSSSNGLVGLSKQKLKIKLKKNRFKLAQKLQKFQNYLRADPNEFCENFVQQTIAMRRNSNCSVGSRSHRTIAQSTSTPPPTTSLSVSPKFILNEQPPMPPPLASVEQTSLEHLSVDMDVALHMMLPPTAMHSSSSATASNASLGSSNGCDAICGGGVGSSDAGGANVAFSGDDYYSSICDNQLSFNNSPCKSPRSLVDIALMSGGGDSASSLGSATMQLRNNQHHHFHHQANNSHHFQQYHRSNTIQSHPLAQQRPSFSLNSNKTNFGRGTLPVPKYQQHQLQQSHKTNVVVVAAKPAKTHAIGFNVKAAAATTAMKEDIDCTHEESNIIKPPSNGFSSTPQNSISDIGTPTENSSLYFTPPSSSVSNENEVFESPASSATKQSTTTPFVFPEMSAEISNVASTGNRLRENCSLTLQLKLSSLDSLNKSKTPSTDEASLESIDHGNSSSTTGTTTGTSSSGFSNSDCCCTGICNCNPLVLDLERYAANAEKTVAQSSSQSLNMADKNIIKE